MKLKSRAFKLFAAVDVDTNYWRVVYRGSHFRFKEIFCISANGGK